MIRPSAGLALASALFALPAGAQELVQVQPAATAFRIGDFEAWAIRDARIVIPNNNKTFGLDQSPAAVSAVLTKAGAPADAVRMSIDALLVKANGRVVLLDTGLGPKGHGALIGSLAMAGVKPEDVTDVLITHAHGDHVGGLLGPDGQSAFPKAAIRLSTKEWAYMQTQAPDLAKAVAAQVKTFEPGQTVVPGITAVAVDGHTPGHVGYEIASGGGRLFDMGDTAHSSIVSLAEPDWAMGFDGDHDLGRKSRRETLARLAKSGETIFAPHFPYPGVGVVQAKDDGFVWVPKLGSPDW